MKTKSKIKILTLVTAIIMASSIAVIATQTTSFAESGSNTNFTLDFGNIENEADYSTSSNFALQSDSPEIATTSSSSNFQMEPSLYTIDAIGAVCGNGTKEAGEECDGSDFGGATCSTYEYDSGSLTCTACVIDNSGCYNSGSGDTGGGGTPFPSYSGGDEDDDEPEDEPPAEEEITEPTPEEPEPEEPEPIPTLFPGYFPEQIPFSEPEEGITDDELVQEYHLEDDETLTDEATLEKEPTKTTDKTPVISNKLEKNTEYKIIITDESGEIIQEATVNTDENGTFVYEPETPLKKGINQFKILDPTNEEKTISTYTLEIIEDGKDELKIITFADKGGIETMANEKIDLGKIEKTKEKMVIIGQGSPFADIFAYFRSEIIIAQTKADETGHFKIEIPKELELGVHEVKILQVSQDKIISENLIYNFELTENDKGLEIIPKDFMTKMTSLVLLIALILSLIICKIKTQKTKTKPKTKKIKNSKK